MLKFIRYTLLIVAFCTFLFGCTTDKLMKKEDFSIEKEMERVTPPEPAKPAGPFAAEKVAKVNPLKGKTITLTASNAAFTDIFAAIAERAGLDLVVDSRLKAGTSTDLSEEAADSGKEKQTAKGPIILPSVSIAFNRTPLEEALENVASALHIFYRVDGRALCIKGTDSRTYHLNFLSSQKQTTMSVGGDVISSSTNSSTSSSTSGGSGDNSLSGEFSIKDTIPVATSDICTQIEDHVKSTLTRDGSYSINRALGFLEVMTGEMP